MVPFIWVLPSIIMIICIIWGNDPNFNKKISSHKKEKEDCNIIFLSPEPKQHEEVSL